MCSTTAARPSACAPRPGGSTEIGPGRIGNVRLLDERGVWLASYCIHPTNEHELPVADIQLSQLLLLRSDEEEFLRVANLHWDRRPEVLPA